MREVQYPPRVYQKNINHNIRIMRIFRKKQIPALEPMKVRKIGNHLPFNEMGAKQNVHIYQAIRTQNI